VWCSDRSITDTNYSLENYATNKDFRYSSDTRLEENGPAVLNLTCSRNVDKFTVEDTNGNGELDHAIGMLTADEIIMAGNTVSIENNGRLVTTYLTIPAHYYWSLSPRRFFRGVAMTFYVNYGELYGRNVTSAAGLGVRPSVSLSNNTLLIGGNGTFSNPYIVG